MDQILDDLFRVHYGWNNFHNEQSYARMLASYVPSTGEIPDEVFNKYVKVLIICGVGNRYGVPDAAFLYYNDLISRFSEKHFLVFVQLLCDTDLQSKMRYQLCSDRYQRMARDFLSKTANSQLKAALDAISNESGANLVNIHRATKFIQMVREITV